MNLPYSSELNIGYLSRLFDNTSNCYKIFWFQAILRKVSEWKVRLTFSELQHFLPSENREHIISFLEDSDDKELLRYKQTLTLNVPYRLQVPFYDEVEIKDKVFQ